MKVVLLALGSRGDVQPMAALGRELASRAAAYRAAACAVRDRMRAERGVELAADRVASMPCG